MDFLSEKAGEEDKFNKYINRIRKYLIGKKVSNPVKMKTEEQKGKKPVSFLQFLFFFVTENIKLIKTKKRAFSNIIYI